MLRKIQNYLQNSKKDAYVIYDYECTAPSLISLVGKRFFTRKIFIVIPSKGRPYVIAHFIDKAYLIDKEIVDNYDVKIYKNWNEMIDLLKDNISKYQSIIMDISDNGLMPRVSYADYGTVTLIKQYCNDVSSSCDLLQNLSSLVKDEAWESEKRASSMCNKIKNDAFEFISKKFINNESVNEYEVQQYIMQRFAEEGMVTDSEPIVAVNGNAGNPHYAPTKEINTPIKLGDVVLIDLWAKYDEDNGVFGDITWMGVVGDIISPKYDKLFKIVKNSVQVALNYLNDNIGKRDVKGYEVDRAVRDYITSEGYGEYFVHRTGHNICIDNSPHGSGVNIDDFETHDTRSIVDGVSFSIEPGIYMDDIGVREEISVHILGDKVIALPEIQQEIIKIKVK